MKKTHTFLNLDAVFDELFDAASQFRNEFVNSINCSGLRDKGIFFDENIDYYPGYSYPPMNIFFTEDKSLNFEFALSGFNEKNIELSFSGDYMIFSARIEDAGSDIPNVRFLKRRLKLKDIEKQKYYVPMDKYAQEKVQAVFKNGILKITIPPRPEKTQSEGINITIITE